MLYKKGYVISALSEWGDLYRNHIDPVIQIFSKKIIPDHIFQVNFSRRDKSYIHFNWFCASNSHNFT